MATITLKHGEICLIDDADFEEIGKGKWYLSVDGYAVSTIQGRRMHKIILGTPNGEHTDHVNGDKLDNRRSNLRVASASQNCANSRVRKNNASGATGISLRSDTKKWRARIMVNRKELALGSFATREEALAARNTAATKYFGEFARKGR